jgi:hypothetical protein
MVNQFDVDETTAPRFLDQVVLSALALEVRLYLRLGRLTHIQHGLALEDRCRKQVSAHPPSRTDSNAMLIWRGCVGGNRAFNENFRGMVILFLLEDVRIATEASPKSAFQE